MPTKYILEQLGNKVGLDPLDSQQRSVLLRLANEGALELYDESDMVGSLMEQYFKINGDQTISFPSFVGELRAARPWDTQVPMHINQMRPRYNTINWIDQWRNYRIKNTSPLHTTVRNQSVVNISVHAVEDPPIEVTVAGPTEYSDNVSETIVMDAVTKQTTNVFNDFTLFTKNRINNYNVIMTDIDDLELSIIPNNQIYSEYLIIDVSLFPFANNDGGSTQAHWVEVLYKKRLTKLSKDSDEFPAPGFDDIIVNKAIQIYLEEQEKVDLALVYDRKASRSTARKNENRNRATEDVIGFVPNPHDTLLAPVRQNRPGWFPRYRGL